MKNFFERLKPDLTYNPHCLVNSLKATFACLIGLFLAKVFHLAQTQWVLISILIVMASQYRLGGAMMKGYARLFATALGSAIAAAILFLFSSHQLLVYCLLFSFIAGFIYLASNSKDYSYSYTLGAVTMVIIVVSDTPSLENALNRLYEILLGVTIAILVSRFIFPIHAEKLLHQNMANTLQLLKKLYQLFIREDKTFSLQSKEQNPEEIIINYFAAYPTLLKEACIESATVKKQRYRYICLLRLERRLLRSIYMLHYTLRVSLKSFSNIINMEEFKILHWEIIITLDDLGLRLENKHYQIKERNLEKAYQEIIVKLRPTFENYTFEEKNKIHAFLFCLGHVIMVLNRLKKLVIEKV